MPSTHRRRLARLAWLLLAPATAQAGPPFTTDDPEPAPNGHFEVYFYSTGVKTQGGFDTALPGLEVNYGAAEDLQLAIAAEQAYSAPRGEPATSRYGSTELGAKYRFIHEDEDGWRPQVAFYPSVDIPDGGHHASTYLPLWLQKGIGEWEVFGGGGPRLNPGPGQRDNWFAGIAALRHMSADLQLGAEVFRETAADKGEPPGTGFNLAALYDFNDTWHLVASAGRGLHESDATNEFSYYLGLELTTP